MITCLSGSCGSLPRPSIVSKSCTTYVYPGRRSKFKERFLLNEYCSRTIVMLKNLNHLKLGVVCTITVHSSVLSHIWNVVYKARIHRVAPLPLPSASESKRIAIRGHCWFYTTILVYNCLRGGIFREVSLAHLYNRTKDNAPWCVSETASPCLFSVCRHLSTAYVILICGATLSRVYLLLESHRCVAIMDVVYTILKIMYRCNLLTWNYLGLYGFQEFYNA